MSDSRLHRKLDRFQSAILGNRRTSDVQSMPTRHQRMAETLGGRIVSNGAGSFCLIKTHYSHFHSHGSLTLADLSENRSFPFSAFTRENEPGSIEPSSLLFIDTETTGLGGTGTVAFLVGCGSMVDGRFELRQYLMPDYSDEAAMLEALLSEFRRDKVVVSYNGAAFDLPLLRDRMIINRVARELEMGRHLDLLHPVRRLFQRRLGDCRLVNIERELMAFERVDDVPGHLIPSIYFDWLSEQNPRGMGRVLEHNRLDVVSLYYLAGLLARTFQTGGETLETVDDLYSLSRVYGRRKENHRVVNLYHRIETVQGEPPADDILLFHALAFKRAGAFDRAVALWDRLATIPSKKEGFQANVELAKHYEHRAKDIKKAYEYARRAGKSTDLSIRQRQLLHKRLARLHSKLST